MAQWYGNVPALSKVTENCAPGATLLEFQRGESDVVVCVTESSFVHVTRDRREHRPAVRALKHRPEWIPRPFDRLVRALVRARVRVRAWVLERAQAPGWVRSRHRRNRCTPR
jgi:hypothetical protein